MPELPEVETVRRGLLKHLPGQRIDAVKVLRPDSIGHPSARHFPKAVIGHTFRDIERCGKYLVFRLDRGAAIVAHLRMSGRLLVDASKIDREEHVRVRMQLSNGGELIFEDMRVFGRLWYVSPEERLQDIVSGLAELGVEPLEKLSGKHLQKCFARRTQTIKSALLDQTIIAGIGNIYADESLHRAGIHPARRACDLSLPELNKLSREIVEVLSQAIAARGSSLRNYTDTEGVNGNYQSQSHVYGRTGKPCRKCKTEITRIKLGGRSTHFCPRCQPAR